MRRALALAFWLLAACAATAARAETPSRSRIVERGVPVLFKADEIQYDRDLGLVVARGHVEISQGNRTLLADTVSYNQNADLLTASGHVVLVEETGNVVFADHVEVTGDFKNGIVEDIRLRLADDSRFAAAGGRLTNGTVTDMRKAVYSPCLPCRQHPESPPTWDVKAVKVTHNRDEHIIEYEDAYLELFGIPVAYTPYFSHPDPTVKRKSGFLAPHVGGDSDLGLLAEVPYYFAIGPDKDATFSPVFTGSAGVVLAGEYRQRFTDGALKLQASGTDGKSDGGDDAFRGHFFGNLRYDLNDTWRMGADAQVASDDTYLRRYRYYSGDLLTNHVFAEGFRGRNYAVGEGYYWRGLKTDDDPGLTPIVAPQLHYSFVGQPGALGGRWNMDSDMLVLTRTDGTDTRRLSFVTGWRLPRIARTGEVYNFYATVQTDGYWTNGLQEPGHPDEALGSDLAGRIFPRIGLDWRFPVARSTTRTVQVIEPVAGIMISPNGGNPKDIPNEDSRDFEFDDTNLTSPDRFGGIDRVEGGQHIYYGLKASLYGPGPAYASAFIGQSYQVRKDDTFLPGSGLEDHFSDLVGRVQVRPMYPIDLIYRFRLDKDNLAARRHEVQLAVGPPMLHLNLGYLFLDDKNQPVDALDPLSRFGTREEVFGTIRTQLTKEWSAAASTRHELAGDGGTLSEGINLTWENDCLAVLLDFARTFTTDRDIKPTDTVLLRLVFKTLGEVKTAGGV